MHIALFQPDIPQNTGTILRMAACLGLFVDIVGPAGFDLSARALKRAGLDYLDRAMFERHADFAHFWQKRIQGEGRRLILASTKAQKSYLDHRFSPGDVILMGRESAGVPEWVREKATVAIKIPMCTGNRSLNLAVSTAIIIGEALRQTQGFPQDQPLGSRIS